MTNKLTTSGMRHVALNVAALEDCLRFYTKVLGMAIEWQPDPDNVFLCSGNDNLALHRMPAGSRAAPAPNPNNSADQPQGDLQPGSAPRAVSRLDHIGFIIDNIDDIDRWHDLLLGADVPIAQPPRTHRDGARSLYCHDPDGTLVQLIYHPPISRGNSGR